MPFLTFPYRPDAHVDPDTHEVSYVYRPYLPVHLTYQGTSIRSAIEALLHSGADHNLFPPEIAERLGISVRQGLLVEHGGIGDSVLRAYRHPLTIGLGNYNFETIVAFSYDHRLPLLGREGFFAHFTAIMFRQSDQEVTVTFPSES